MSTWAMQHINFIASLLGLSRGNIIGNTSGTQGSLENATASPLVASCTGWSRPDLAVQLRYSADKTVRIFGFPQEDLPAAVEVPLESFGNIGPPLLYLRGDIPAYVSYIMGSAWRENLRDDHQTDPRHMYHDGQVILRPGTSLGNETAVDEELARKEQAHCKRMLRCGAKAVRSEEPDVSEFSIFGWPDYPKQIFGWPSSGGVWILRRPEFDQRVHMLDPIRENPETYNEFRRQEIQYGEFRKSLSQYTDMDELCRALQSAGAEFYEAVADCPEAIELGLDMI